jgi:ribonuclease D
VDWRLIESDAALRQLLDQAAGCEAVIVDTEFMRRNTFYPQVALLQLCFSSGPAADCAWLIDPLTIEDTSGLAALLGNMGVLKVLHSASEDLEVFQRWLGVLPQPLFDTQRAAGLLDIGFGLGYAALVQEICNVELPKGETRSDWLQRPLTDAQCEYAAQDVSWLLQVWRELHPRAAAQGKLEWILADGADATAAMGNGLNSYFQRIKTAWKLNSRQLGSLVALCEWREQTARDRDKPRSWIIDDKACLQLAQSNPDSYAAMRDTADLPPPALRRYSEELLQVLAQQRAVPDNELPQRLPTPLNARQRDLLKKMKAQIREIAGSLESAPEALLQGKDYELLLRDAIGETVVVPAHWQGWRQQQVIEPLRRYLVDII